ncbi:hypothetical protein Hanom_Chr04g00334941 [Helianthus anomalus]
MTQCRRSSPLSSSRAATPLPTSVALSLLLSSLSLYLVSLCSTATRHHHLVVAAVNSKNRGGVGWSVRRGKRVVMVCD